MVRVSGGSRGSRGGGGGSGGFGGLRSLFSRKGTGSVREHSVGGDSGSKTTGGEGHGSGTHYKPSNAEIYAALKSISDGNSRLAHSESGNSGNISNGKRDLTDQCLHQRENLQHIVMAFGRDSSVSKIYAESLIRCERIVATNPHHVPIYNPSDEEINAAFESISNGNSCIVKLSQSDASEKVSDGNADLSNKCPLARELLQKCVMRFGRENRVCEYKAINLIRCERRYATKPKSQVMDNEL